MESLRWKRERVKVGRLKKKPVEVGHRGFLQLDCFLTSFALPPLALSDSYFSLTGGSVLMMVMSGDILQVVHRMHAAVGERLPLVAHLRAVNSQCVVGLVVAAAAGV